MSRLSAAMSVVCQHAMPLRSRISLRRLRRRMSQYKHGSFGHRMLTVDAVAAWVSPDPTMREMKDVAIRLGQPISTLPASM